MTTSLCRIVVGILFAMLAGQAALGQQPPATSPAQQPVSPKKLDCFPAATQFSPVPSGKGWNGQKGPIDEKTLRDTIDNILAHGFTGLQMPAHRPQAEENVIRDYAQSRGMFVTFELGSLEHFDRENPPKTCVYSPQYAQEVRSYAQRALAVLKGIPRQYNVFTYQDEPFHAGPKSFGYNAEVKAEFKRRYGYDLPPDLDSIRRDPKRWLDVINFRSDYFPDGWRQVYKIIKEIDPGFKVILTHDSHNTLGGGCGSSSELAIDDVFHWGGDFADMFVFDIYPYMMFDFRFGEPSRLPKPRISQTHYCFAQMRNLARAYGKELGFWVGTYNPAWFKDFMGPELQAKHWSEREMSATAVAQGADYLLTGYNIPADARHWESFGEGLRLIQRAGGRLLAAPKVKARAAMLFPRTQTIQVQEEYFNVGLSYELFLRAFGELDILHEEQIKDDRLDGYQVLVLFDVTLLPTDVARRIAAFVQNGGVVIADCVPNADAYKQPTTVMEELFGVKGAKTDRAHRTGHWVPRVTGGGYWAGKQDPNESKVPTDAIKGTVLGQPLDLMLVSPRPATVTTGEILLKTAAGQPAAVTRSVGKGRVFLLGFCVQDTYFKTWQDQKPAAREQLAGMLHAMTKAAGVRAHVHSSNQDIEASVRANAAEGFLFVISHEAPTPDTAICLADLGFEIGKIVDLANGQAIPFTTAEGVVQLTLSVPVGQTRLLLTVRK
jgi:hypothetical protein